MKRLLLIGGTGAIGTELAKEITCFDVIIAGSKDYDVTGCFGVNQYQDIDIVVSLAGVTQDGPVNEFHRCTRNTIMVNCFGAVNIITDFPTAERIIFISSIYSTTVVPGQGVYGACKAFMDRLVRNAAIENPACTYNTIQLGYMGIGMGEMTEPEKALHKVTKKRFCTIEELWKTIEFIIYNEYISGQNIRLDGGMR